MNYTLIIMHIYWNLKIIFQCLVPLHHLDGVDILTTEGIGSRTEGYHPIHDSVTNNHGSQCGICTPGMVMSMYR